MFILLACLFSLVLAEPPVSDSYLEALHTVHVGNNEHHLPTDLSVPSARSYSNNALNDQFTRSSSRTVSQEYGTPFSRNSATNSRNLKPQEYTVPNSRHSSTQQSLTSRFGSTSSKSSLSRSYGAPISKNAQSNSYDAPSQRSPLTQHGVPESGTVSEDYASTSSRKNVFGSRNSSPIQKYGLPQFSSNSRALSRKHDDQTKPNLSRNVQSSIQSPQGFSSVLGSSSRSLSTHYGAPAARNAINSEVPARSYGVPSERIFSQGYSDSEIGRMGLNNKAFTSTFSSGRSPSQEYGAPSSRDAMPSLEYGASYDASSDRTYEYARDASDLQDQEPANYEFSYKVNDNGSGSDYGHVERRREGGAAGAYFVVLPDGSKQIVEYEADEGGFKPTITVQTADSGSAFAVNGPY